MAVASAFFIWFLAQIDALKRRALLPGSKMVDENPILGRPMKCWPRAPHGANRNAPSARIWNFDRCVAIQIFEGLDLAGIPLSFGRQYLPSLCLAVVCSFIDLNS